MALQEVRETCYLSKAFQIYILKVAVDEQVHLMLYPPALCVYFSTPFRPYCVLLIVYCDNICVTLDFNVWSDFSFVIVVTQAL